MSICIFFLLYYSRNIQDRQSISTNPGRWQIGSNRKVNLLVSQLFWGWEEVQKGHFRFGLSFTKMQHGGNMDLLIEQRKLSDFDWIISLGHQVLKIARKSVKRSFGAVDASFELDSQHCHRAILIN